MFRKRRFPKTKRHIPKDLNPSIRLFLSYVACEICS